MKELVLIEDLGMRYPNEQSKQRRRYGLYKCFCGNTFENQIDAVKRGLVKSCGCLRHLSLGGADSKHTLYSVWNSMKQRCYNPNNSAYKDYGARGIIVCNRWLSFKNFIEDMYPSYRDDLSLDRIDVNGNYEPDNCRWANPSTQARNTRDLQKNNISGYRGVSFHTKKGKFIASIQIHSKKIYLGAYQTALEAAKAYERYVRLNKLEHNFTPVLSEFEILELETK